MREKFCIFFLLCRIKIKKDMGCNQSSEDFCTGEGMRWDTGKKACMISIKLLEFVNTRGLCERGKVDGTVGTCFLGTCSDTGFETLQECTDASHTWTPNAWCNKERKEKEAEPLDRTNNKPVDLGVFDNVASFFNPGACKSKGKQVCTDAGMEWDGEKCKLGGNMQNLLHPNIGTCTIGAHSDCNKITIPEQMCSFFTSSCITDTHTMCVDAEDPQRWATPEDCEKRKQDRAWLQSAMCDGGNPKVVLENEDSVEQFLTETTPMGKFYLSSICSSKQIPCAPNAKKSACASLTKNEYDTLDQTRVNLSWAEFQKIC